MNRLYFKTFQENEYMLRKRVTKLTPCIRVLLENNSHSASKEISRLLWITKFHHRVHKPTSLLPIPSQMNPVHILQLYRKPVNRSVIVKPDETNKCSL